MHVLLPPAEEVRGSPAPAPVLPRRLVLKIGPRLRARSYGPKLIVSVIFIAIGAVAAVPFKDPSVTVLGVVLVCVATLASSLKPVVGELLMTASQKPKLAPAGAPQRRTCRAPGRRRLVCGAPLLFAHPPCVLSPRAQLWSSTTRASRSSS